VGTLKITTVEAGSEIRVDGDLIGKTPLAEPLRLNAGRHVVQALLYGYSPLVREVELVGKAVVEVEFDFPDEALPVPAAQLPKPVAARQAPPEGQPSLALKSLPQPTEPARDAPPTNWLRMTGYGVALGGVVLGTVGGLKVFNGVNQARDAKHRMSEADSTAQYDAALPDYQAGKALTETGWVLAGVGMGALLGGALLVLAAPSSESSAAGVRAWVTADSGGLHLDGVW
jgi:hypothetical protein